MLSRSNQSRTFFALLCLTSLWLADAPQAHAQTPAAPPPATTAPPPAAAPPAYPPQGYPPQQAYPQQAYPQQAYPQPAYAQPPYAAPPPRAQRPRVKRGMLAAGISVLAASYGVALVTGAILVDTNCCSEAGAMMMIPVAGPYIAASVADNGKGLLVLLGTVEVVGAGLLIGGIVRYVASKNAAEEQGYYSWKLPHERSLGVALSTSPALLGPRLKLRF